MDCHQSNQYEFKYRIFHAPSLRQWIGISFRKQRHPKAWTQRAGSPMDCLPKNCCPIILPQTSWPGKWVTPFLSEGRPHPVYHPVRGADVINREPGARALRPGYREKQPLYRKRLGAAVSVTPRLRWTSRKRATSSRLRGSFISRMFCSRMMRGPSLIIKPM